MSNLNSSTQSFGMQSNDGKLPTNKRRSYILCLASVLLACVIGFVIGYFIPKCSEESSSTENTHEDGKRQEFERKLLSTLDSKEIKNVSR